MYACSEPRPGRTLELVEASKSWLPILYNSTLTYPTKQDIQDCCCLGVAPRALLLKKSVWLLHLIGDKATPAARDSNDVARALKRHCHSQTRNGSLSWWTLFCCSLNWELRKEQMAWEHGFPTVILHILLDNTPLHSKPSVWRHGGSNIGPNFIKIVTWRIYM